MDCIGNVNFTPTTNTLFEWKLPRGSNKWVTKYQTKVLKQSQFNREEIYCIDSPFILTIPGIL